jgi:hypothetical protein
MLSIIIIVPFLSSDITGLAVSSPLPTPPPFYGLAKLEKTFSGNHGKIPNLLANLVNIPKASFLIVTAGCFFNWPRLPLTVKPSAVKISSAQ